MSLTAGSCLGPYEIQSALGAGGMGEVYRAHDTKLGRDVALKILPDSFVHDPDRVTRFRREAQVLASLNHPHIAAIYGLEEANGSQFLILELVEGETLAERLKAGPLPLDEALAVARQIVEALEAAHEKGIIHRDLKPANIAFTPNGLVKVLDFGLAKALGPVVTDAGDMTASPTITTPAMTQMGMILGTAAYMSPEQAKGRVADKRSDIWAFGCVLYEMLSGRRAFEGEDVSDTLANVLKSEPDWNALPPTEPPLIRLLVQRCVEKDYRRRIADVSTAGFLLNESTTSTLGHPAVVAAPPFPHWQRVATSAALLFLGALIAGTGVWFAMRPAVPRVARWALPISSTAAAPIPDAGLAVTPDGSRVIYVGNNQTQLFVRPFDALEPIAVTTGTAIRDPFVSPDGQWIGFADFISLKKVPLSGGPAITVARLDAVLRGATWAPDDTVIYSTGSSKGLLRVSATAGGTPTSLVQRVSGGDEAHHFYPEVLPGGRAVLFTIVPVGGHLDASQVAVRDLRTGAQKILVPGGRYARYIETGHLVYMAGGALYAVPFDLRRLEVRGTSVSVVPQMVTSARPTFAVAADGTLVYVVGPSGATLSARTMVWVDRAGREEAIGAPALPYQFPRLSPDGNRVAVARSDSHSDQDRDIWIWNFGHKNLIQFTVGPANNLSPVWTADSKRVVFYSNRESGSFNLWWQAADGSGNPERLTTSVNVQVPNSTSTNGTTLIFSEVSPTMGLDLMQLSLDQAHRVTPLLQTVANETNGEVSPDGHWLTYESDSSGHKEIYVRPYPNTSQGPRQISTAGGMQPVWARSGKELFYLAPDGSLMNVNVDASSGIWRHDAPVRLFQGPYYTHGSTPERMYDVSLDGQRFLMLRPAEQDQRAVPPTIVIVQNFADDLKTRVPVK
jgi:serine/threonine-protein kinase